MGRALSEVFSNIKGESRAYKETERKTAKGNAFVYSCINMEPDYQAGVLTTSKGFKKILSLNNYKKVDNINISLSDAGAWRFTAISGGAVYDIANWQSGTISKSVKHTGMNENFTDIIPVNDRTDGSNYLVLLDGGYPKKYDFSTVANLTENHNASFGMFYNDRLWTNDVDEKNLAKWSAAGDPSAFTTVNNAGFLPMGDALNPLTAMSTLYVPQDNSTHIVLAKRDEIWGISGNSGSIEDATRFQSYSMNIGETGTQSPRGLCKAGQEVYVLGDSDIKPYSTLNNYGIIKPNDISENIRPIYRENVNKDKLDQAFMFFDDFGGKTGRLYSFVPTNSLERNTKAFVYDYSGGWFRRDFHSFGFSCMCKDPLTNKIYAGDYFGNIYEFNTGFNYDGKAYSKFVDFGFVDFGAPKISKSSGVNSYIDMEVINAESLEIATLIKNNNAILASKKTLSFENYKYGYDEVSYNETIYDYKHEIKEAIEMEGVFDEFCVQVSNTSIDTNFKIKKLYLEAEAGVI